MGTPISGREEPGAVRVDQELIVGLMQASISTPDFAARA